ncbi:MAG: hypothetical protein FWH23_02455 [Bacteroidales bacterium]|nr:hypothetical protein [Bacteroidales bacterium]
MYFDAATSAKVISLRSSVSAAICRSALIFPLRSKACLMPATAPLTCIADLPACMAISLNRRVSALNSIIPSETLVRSGKKGVRTRMALASKVALKSHWRSISRTSLSFNCISTTSSLTLAKVRLSRREALIPLALPVVEVSVESEREAV